MSGLPVTLSESGQRLLALVALQGTQRRTFLAGVLWPEIRDEQALARLRSALWRLRRVGPRIVQADERTIGLAADIDVDVNAMVASARALMAGDIEPSDLTRSFDRLVAAGELLVGWYEDWVLLERERLEQLRIHALELLVDELVKAARYAEALEAATTAVRLDPLRESTHRSVVRVYLAEGNPASARRQVDRYRQILRSEMGIDEPTPAMLGLLSPPTSLGS